MVIFRLRIQYLLTFSLLFTAVQACPGRAESLGLDFSLPAAPSVSADPVPQTPSVVPRPQSIQGHQPLPVPKAASKPPTRSSRITPPSTVYGGVDGLSIPSNKANEESKPVVAQLPPPPPLPASVPSSQVFPPLRPASESAESSLAATQEQVATNSGHPAPTQQPESADTVTFEIPQVQQQLQVSPAARSTTMALNSGQPASLAAASDMSWIFEGASDSLVARAIGSAEGTRTPEGKRTRYYRGHTDPGNGVWNLGTFSYQHGASSPEEADAKQLARLKRQGETLTQKAQKAGIEMDLVRTLNALDLANQSPAAALNRGGYIDRLVEAESQGLQGEDAILWARINSYRNPDTQRWNAPGLGNTLQGVSRDQKRRFDAIASALNSYQQEKLAVVPGSLPETRVLPPAYSHGTASPVNSTVTEPDSSAFLKATGTQPISIENRVDFSLSNETVASNNFAETNPIVATTPSDSPQPDEETSSTLDQAALVTPHPPALSNRLLPVEPPPTVNPNPLPVPQMPKSSENPKEM